jgi:cytosine deaminase
MEAAVQAQGSDNRPLDPGLLDALWDFDDPAVSEQRFRGRIAYADLAAVATQELATQLARALGMQGRFEEASEILDSLTSQHPVVLARMSLERGRLRHSVGDRPAAVSHFAAGLDHARAVGDDFLAADAAHMLAIADERNAGEWVRVGLAIIDSTTDARARRWRGPLHNNLGWTLHDRGDHDEALEQFRLAQAAFERGGTAAQVNNARWAVARCLRALGRCEEALAIQQRLLANDSPDPYVDEQIDTLRTAIDHARGGGKRMTEWNRASFEKALAQAEASLSEGGVPVGSALDIGGELIASGHNRRVQDGNPIAHGEMSCLRAAGRQRSYRDAVLYTTLAPCAMCAGAIVQFGIPTVVVGESETFPGELDWLRSRGVEVIELDDERCKALMTEFQTRYPAVWAEDIGED